MKLIPFRTESDGDADLILVGYFQGTKLKNKYPHYEVKLGYNPATKEIIKEKSSCQCWSQIKGRNENSQFMCKHLKTMIKVIENFPEELE
jgi:hypothetical protein